MEQSTQLQQFDKLFSAFSKAQSEFPEIEKNKTVKKKYQDKSGQWREYEFDYADLSEIVSKTRGPLTKNGLGVSQTIEFVDGKVFCVSRLFHSSGQFLTSTCPVIGNPKDAQELGAQITYAKRYSLSLLLGVVADDDNDGNVSDFEVKDKRPKHLPEQKQKTIVNHATGETKKIQEQRSGDVGSYVIQCGKKYKGMSLDQLGYDNVESYMNYFLDGEEKSGKPLDGPVLEFVTMAQKYLSQGGPEMSPPPETNFDAEEIPF